MFGMSRLTVTLCSLLLTACATPPSPAPRPEPVVAETWPGTSSVTRQGRLYFAGQPSAAGLRHAAKLGVKTVINLRAPNEMKAKVPFDEPSLARELGMRYVSIPVTPPTFAAEHVKTFAAELRSAQGAVLFHCSSANRVGGLWAVYLMREEGVAYAEAVARGKKVGLKKKKMVDAVRRVAQPKETP